ncbi:DUF2264 domain-containing protein [Vibrio sp. MA40-2]|uniref:DUF2264 domain-containing protein n=1 Tax=Vibrio sp. MA40-2 TaxID=3391828 RepID=UPI0039A67FA4
MKQHFFFNNPMQTKQDFQQLVCDLFEPLIPFYQQQGARIDLDEGGACFDMVASSVEGVARPLWGLIPLQLGGGQFEHWPLVRQLIINGTDPESDQYWGELGEIDQRSVEMAPIALWLILLPEIAWQPLTKQQQHNLVHWLASIQDKPTSQNNWLFFTIFVQQSLRSVGWETLVNKELEQQFLQRIRNWYLGDGWYGDGDIESIDHYCGYAMHYYGLIYSQLFEHANPEFAALFKDNADAFSIPFQYWFAETGETLVQGRSLTYRFASAGFWGAYALCPQTSIPMGEIKGLWARQIRRWKHQPIFTQTGILTRGFDYPNTAMCEVYNSPTSPYWAMKAFIPLLLADDSSFWTNEEQPCPKLKKIMPMPHNKTIVQRVDGHSIVHYASNVHPGFQLDKYNKFAYSTFGGMDINALLYSEKLSFGDNILALSFDGGANWQMRQKNNHVELLENKIIIQWQSGLQKVTTTIDILDNGQCIRSHELESDREVWIVESGFAVGKWYQEEQLLDQLGNEQPTRKALLSIKGSNGISTISNCDNHMKTAHCTTRVHSDVSFPRSAVPYLLSKHKAGTILLSSRFSLSKTHH